MYDFRFYQACMKKTQLVLFFAKFHKILTWKRMISIYAKDFFMKKKTQICQISKKNNIQIATFLWKVQEGSQEYARILVFFYFHISYVAESD
jgi:hypothetical protein